MTVRFFSVCSGIEAASVAWKPLGWQCVGFAEIEKFPSAVLAHHYPSVKNHGDFTKVDTRTLGTVDILCGGTPCQAFSVAGLRGSLDDARGNLTLSFVGLAHDLAARNGLRNVVWENVPGVLSTKDNAFGCFLAGLVGAVDALPPPGGKRWPNAGLVAGPKGRAAWRVLDAQYFGLAQRRKRVIVVADFGNGADPAAVLFEPESVRRDSPPSRETGQRTPSGFEVGPSGGSFTDVAPTLDCRAKNGPVQNQIGVGVLHAPEITGALCANGKAAGSATSQDADSNMLIPVAFGGNRTSGPIDVATACNAHAGRMDFESETLICFSAKDYGADATNDLSPTLRAGGHTGSHANAGVMPAISYSIQERAVSENLENGPQGKGYQPHIAYTLEARNKVQAVSTSQAVRRLTPRECERLQGFPDDYTRIPWRGRPADVCPDGPRYKALGNSWAVPKFHWLGARLDAALRQADPLALAIERYRRQRRVLAELLAA